MLTKEEVEFGHKWFAEERRKKLKHHSEKQKGWLDNHPNYTRDYYTSHVAECSKRSKGYYASHKDKYIAINKEWREDNPDYKAKWRAKHPEWDSTWWKTDKGKAARQRMYAKRHAIEATFVNNLTHSEWLDILEKHDYRCAYCGCDLNDSPAERDHIIPISRGGDNVKENIVPACRSCNARKGNR